MPQANEFRFPSKKFKLALVRLFDAPGNVPVFPRWHGAGHHEASQVLYSPGGNECHGGTQGRRHLGIGPQARAAPVSASANGWRVSS